MAHNLLPKKHNWIATIAVTVAIIGLLSSGLGAWIHGAYARGALTERVSGTTARVAAVEARSEKTHDKLDRLLEGNAYLKAMLQLHMGLTGGETAKGDSDEKENIPNYRDDVDADLYDDDTLRAWVRGWKEAATGAGSLLVQEP